MQFLADENIDQSIIDRLRKEGYTVFSVREDSPGISDQKVIQRAYETKAVILTEDKDFGELSFLQKKITQGAILIRLAGLSIDEKANIVSGVIRAHEDSLPKNFTVISPNTVRIRKNG